MGLATVTRSVIGFFCLPLVVVAAAGQTLRMEYTDPSGDGVPLIVTTSIVTLSNGPVPLTAVLDGASQYQEYVKTSETTQTAVTDIQNPISLPPKANMLLVRIKKRDETICPEVTDAVKFKDGEQYAPCELVVVYTRDIAPGSDIAFNARGNWHWAFAINAAGLRISDELRAVGATKSHPERPLFVVNGVPIDDIHEPTVRAAKFLIQRYPGSDSCSLYQDDGTELLDIVRPGPALDNSRLANGIAVATPKIFDTTSLQQMLASTAAQLQSISGFNQSSLLSALGNVQGITRDTSYLSGQVTTTPGPNVTSTVGNGTTSGASLANTLGTTNSAVLSNSTIQCPPGTLPAVGTSGLPACAALQSSTTGTTTGNGNVAGGSSSMGSMQTTNGGSTNTTLNNQQGATNSNSTTTTANGQAGTVAPVPVSNAFAAPTSSLGLSSSDMLAEQVQLNSQITTLRLLLQGALSDQYLVENGHPTDVRAQTTLGFGISLNPPKRFRHAVAEVRVWIYSYDDLEQVHVINLLPADKTYNVAKITSHQNAFGAGVVVEPVSLSGATGRSKDRLYLAKDTDTVALQYQPQTQYLPRSVQEHVGDISREALIWQKLYGDCQSEETEGDDALVFGWQFRPVLGADYVQPGERLVYAQLALPVPEATPFTPRVYIQTRWREYDEKQQIVGAVYPASCSVSVETNPILFTNKLRVHDVHVDDMGGGMLKVATSGEFFSSGFSAMNGSSMIAPAVFDGKEVQLFAPAASLLMARDLTLVGKDGKPIPLGRTPRFEGAGNGCSVNAQLSATPQPDGNSLVELSLRTERNYTMRDRSLQPLVLIGSQVYGLHETPFLEGDSPCSSLGEGAGLSCTYHFLASTTALRNAGTFRMADLSWTNVRKDGRIIFGPSFSGVSALVTANKDAGSGSASTSGSKSVSSTVSAKTKALQTELNELPAGSKDLPAKQAELAASKKADAANAAKAAVPVKTKSPESDPTSALIAALTSEKAAAKDAATKAKMLEQKQVASDDAAAKAKTADEAWTKKNDAATTMAKKTAEAVAKKAASSLAQTQTASDAAAKKAQVANATLTTAVAAVTAITAKNSTTAIYSLTGFDLDGVKDANRNWNCTESGCLELFRGATRFVLDPANFTISSKTNAVLSMADAQNQADLMSDYATNHPREGLSPNEAAAASALASTANAKLRWIYHAKDMDASTYEWDLSLPAATAASAVTASDVLNVGDSRQIIFSNVSLSAQPLNLMFDGQVLPKETWTYNQSSQKMTVLISTLITKEPGHKEILASDMVLDATSPTGTKVVALPFDVTRR